jgi:uncharacterized repeat protein (TIGR04138 family)
MPFWDAVDRIRAVDSRYRREAYGFVLAALGEAVRSLPKERRSDPGRRHLSGQELVQAVISLARTEFGLMAPAVFQTWGVVTSMDLGEIVFQLVECGQLSARPEDRREDFTGGPDLLPALVEGLELGVPQLPGPPHRSRGPRGTESGSA